MGRSFSIISTVIVTAILVGALWIFVYNIGAAGSGASSTSRRIEGEGDEAAIASPAGGRSIEVAQGLVVGPAGLAIPVAGIKANQLTDTFTQARAGGRRHDAIDIMAAEGTPVVVAAPGTVEKLFNSALGGITAYVRSEDGKWLYYYAHLQSYAPGLHEGQKVAIGAPIGRVGHTGDANPAGPHLHFAIDTMNPGDKWWEGTPVNPYPLLAGKSPHG